MATGTFYLKPSEDVSVEGDRYTPTSTPLYESLSSTGIVVQSPPSSEGGGQGYLDYVFKCYGDIPIIENFKITDVSVKVTMSEYYMNLGECYVEYIEPANWNEGGNVFRTDLSCETETTYYDIVAKFSDISSHLTKITLENIFEIEYRLYIRTVTETTEKNTQNGRQGKVDIKSFEIEYTYEGEIVSKSGIRTKISGVWKTAIPYQKQNGVWIKITEEEAKTILASNIIVKS